jgi:hypothetical protein
MLWRTLMEKPEKRSNRDILAEVMVRGPEGLIEESEARGQQQLVESQAIPVRWGMGAGEPAELDAKLAELGFELGDPYPDDDLFRPAKLPEGWGKAATGHSMHSDILDERGFARIGVFYKAAFYDRRADMRLHRRILTAYDPRRGFDEKHYRVVWAAMPVTGGRESYTILESFHSDDYAEVDDLADAWVTKNYPDWRNPLAYWDVDVEGTLYQHKD